MILNQKINSKWERVSKFNKCPICDHDSWCGMNESGIICMRVPSEVTTKNGGWLHKLGEEFPKYIPKPKEPEIKLDCVSMWKAWHKETSLQDLRDYAQTIDVDPLSLAYLGCVKAPEHSAFACPMRNHKGDIIGFRLRNKYGDKWSVKGSKQGLFYSRKVLTGTVFIVEGPTDCAAALTIGVSVIGRPSCLGCEEMIADMLKYFKIRQAVLVPDNDEPGLRGADRLQPFLKINHCKIILPTKDMREFYQFGGNKETLESLTRNTIWEKVN